MKNNLSILLVTGIALCSASVAYARPDTRAMTCSQTRALIQSNHAVVLTTGANTYDRFVRQFGVECDWPEIPISISVPTRNGGCWVYRCGEPASNLFPN
ncbi:MAG: hypothetical protein JF620_05615 [Mesorhizobium sp.]|nr:hypothetical protein [Mesorhizobium sp.]